MDSMNEVVRRIVETVHPKQVVLFGSRARGDNRPDSDVDLLIIQESNLPRFKRSIPIRKAIAGLLPSKDIIVYTPEEVREWEGVPNSFIMTALSQGKVLYEEK